MGERKCIYTGRPAKAMETFIPERLFTEEERHNWVMQVPISIEYKNLKKDRLPNDLETEAFETFVSIEKSKIKLKFLEEKLLSIQEKINKSIIIEEKNKPTKSEKIKESSYKKMRMEKEAIEQSDAAIELELNNNKNKLKFKW